MLDKRLTYTCGYWGGSPPAGGLDDAQEAKLELVCKKIGLKQGQKILDIGSGWGSFIGYAAEKYGVNAVGITVSKEQKELADKLYKHLPVETRLQDYRDINPIRNFCGVLGLPLKLSRSVTHVHPVRNMVSKRGKERLGLISNGINEKFDHVVSLGMFEHVGYKNYRTFMKVVHNALKDGGLFLLHTIGVNRSMRGTDPWIEKYIFPNSMLPSIRQISKAIEGLFVMEDWHNFGADYDKTLMAWYNNFAGNWEKIKSNYDERFYRMWRYYLLACAGSFRARKNQLWQIVLSKKGVPGGYTPVR